MKNREVVFILDRSGSMHGLEYDTVAGFNSMLEKQKGNVLVSTVLFNDRTFLLHDRIPIQKVQCLSVRDFEVGGCTALLDALGSTIERMDGKNVLFVIITDGLENASERYSYRKVKSLIESRKEKYGWEFLFLGANMDAMEEAGKFGIDAENAVDYCCDSKGTQLNFEAVSKVLCAGSVPKGWKKDIEADYKKRR